MAELNTEHGTRVGDARGHGTGQGLVLIMAVLALAVAPLAGCGGGNTRAEVQTEVGQAIETTTTYLCAVSETETCGSQGPDPAAAGPDGCGLEVNACSKVNPTPDDVGPAECTTDSYREAVRSDIDGGSFTTTDARCDGTWAAFVVDRSADACPAADGPQSGCAPGTRAHRTFWQNKDGHWRVLTYGGTGDCAEVHAVAPDFPDELCGS
jgi:hypothetical protein